MPDLISVLLNAFPMVLLIAVWIFFMMRLRNGGFNTKYQTAYLEQLQRQNANLERIAAALEKRD
jgi:ATP-dependent Zn protease